MLVTGENGAGKTNLLEALHVGTQGFSPRTRTEGQLVRFGETRLSSRWTWRRGGVRTSGSRSSCPTGAGEAGRARTARALPSAEFLRREFRRSSSRPTGSRSSRAARPCAARTSTARSAGCSPAARRLPQDYAAALAQRNAALRRVQLGLSPRDVLAPWTERVAELGARSCELAGDAIAALAPGFAERAGELGLADARLALRGRAAVAPRRSRRGSTPTSRAARRASARTSTTSSIAAGSRDLRSFGSQGEQRLAVLALLLAEAELLNRVPLLLLLDDVLSELDPAAAACSPTASRSWGRS